ncbi:outer membrane lipoprotein-sorting protein [Hyphococcus luteus]|uniref:Outer membrane lipoprotein-sorting protein n=1 Tax=Hyphococcus luteus TaxID=2058213 RepID=A0A2S7KAH6_9PROT|nr:outer membrane lipoprotein-sorting protein [Marinicaulis flavus]PQA89524.1 outer membrane lipoprotein-sorting protein [Marinicaulis flavus]
MLSKTLKLAAAVTALSISTAFAQDVQEIVDKASAAAYYQGEDGRAKVHMSIKDSQERERTRDFVILRKDIGDVDNGEQRFYVFFERPADVNKTAFLVWKQPHADDDRWLYLPALDLVKRIAPSDERTSFVGSHFFYEDVSGRNPDEDNHVLEEETDDYYVVRSTPKDASDVEFSSYKNWIHKASFIPVKTEYYDENGEAYRTYTALGVETIDGHPTVVKSSMADERIGGVTEMTYSEVAYDTGLPEDIFTERYLRNPPRRELR